MSPNLGSMTDDLLLTGRVALIAGGAGSIGQAVAARLSHFGAIVVTVDRPGSGADFEVDLTDPEVPDAVVVKVFSVHGSLDILVNCQGITGASVPLWEQTDENWDAVLEICLTSVFRLTRSAVQMMRHQGRGGAIVSLASVAGKEGKDRKSVV